MSDSRPHAVIATEADGQSRGRPLILHVLTILILLSPLPFGAYPAWAWATLSAMCGLLLVTWGVFVFAGRIQVVAPTPLILCSAVAFGISLCWGLVQTLNFTPESWHHPIWSSTSDALGLSDQGFISLDPVAGRDSLLRLTTYAGIFWLAFQYNRNIRHARYTLRAIAICTALYAMYGLIVLFLELDSILWFKKSVYTDVVTATFVNPNSFGTYCGIGLLCSTALLMKQLRIVVAERIGFIERSHSFLIEFIPRNASMLIAWSVLASALILSLSRGAVAATGLALLSLYLVLLARRRISVRKVLFRAFGAVLAVCLMLFMVGQDLMQKLWKIGSDFPIRSEIYSRTLVAIEDRPMLGTGLGTFADVYRSYRTEETRPGVVVMAHNDYLEIALELGIPAGILLVLAIVSLAVICVRGVWIRRRSYEYPALGFAACVLVGTHSLVDFSLQIPAIAATFSLVLGLAVAQSRSTAEGGG